MPRPGLLATLALAWYLLLLAWVAPKGNGGERWSGSATATSGETLKLAMAVLRGTSRLYAAQIGYAGLRPPEALAWQAVARSVKADSLFKALVQTPSPVGQLYGLAGVYWTDTSAYPLLAAHRRSQSGSVSTMVGCIARYVSIAEVVREIDTGRWTAELRVGQLLPHR